MANLRAIAHHVDDPETRTVDCLECGHPIVAVSAAGLMGAMEAHRDYINDTADRATDPHFEALRLTELLES